MPLPIIDMHCDLLSFAANKSQPMRALNDPQALCSLTQQKQGSVSLQILAMFAPTRKGSTKHFAKQLEVYKALIDSKQSHMIDSWRKDTGEHHVGYSIENASLLLEEFEPIDVLESRFASLIQAAGPMAYVSLTWNDENRFAGGNLSNKGLKSDGKRCLDLMAKFSAGSKIAIDFSHTSDHTAYNILEYLEQTNLPLTPIASHSNYRSVQDMTRNLPSDVALEIGNRGGIIGLNLVNKFIGEHPKAALDHIGRALDLHLKDHIVFGADFFGPVGIEDLDLGGPHFFESLGNSSCYPHLTHMIEETFDKEICEKIAWKNAQAYFQRAGFIS